MAPLHSPLKVPQLRRHEPLRLFPICIPARSLTTNLSPHTTILSLAKTCCQSAVRKNCWPPINSNPFTVITPGLWWRLVDHGCMFLQAVRLQGNASAAKRKQTEVNFHFWSIKGKFDRALFWLHNLAWPFLTKLAWTLIYNGPLLSSEITSWLRAWVCNNMRVFLCSTCTCRAHVSGRLLPSRLWAHWCKTSGRLNRWTDWVEADTLANKHTGTYHRLHTIDTVHFHP